MTVLPASPEVLVVGGGPAGSTAARLLAGRGHEVWLVDRAAFPRPKPCGECVNPGAVRLLGRLGALDTVRALGPARLDGWSVRGSGAGAEGTFGRGAYGLGVARARLDAALLRQAVAEGVRVVEGVRVEGVDAAGAGGGGPGVRLREGGAVRTVRPRAVVGADGLRSRVARSLGRIVRSPRLRKVSLTARLAFEAAPGGRHLGRLVVHDGVTLGLAPVSADGLRWNATVVADGRASRRPAVEPRAWVEAVLRARLGDRLPPWRVVGGPWASGPFDAPVRDPWAPGVVLVGDAAGYYDPFTGQGIYRALRSAELASAAVSEALATGARPDWRALARYGRAWRRETRGPRCVQRAVEAVLARPGLREPVLGALGASRGLRTVVRITGDLDPVTFLLAPGWWGPAARAALAGRP